MAASTGSSSLEFVLGSDPVTSDEEPAFDEALRAGGLDRAYWAMNGLLATRSRSDTPLVLRGYRHGRLVALAHLMECRRTNQCLFPGRLGMLLDTLPTPGYCWTRGDPAVDLVSSPGVVAAGEDPAAFYRDAVGFLNGRYLMGAVLEESAGPTAAPCVETQMMDWGRYTVRRGGIERLFAAHGSLRRKVNKFRNKLGTLEIVHGALPPEGRRAVESCIRQSAGHALVRTPFQENYLNMVRWPAEHGSQEIVHVLARIDGTVVGYHTYLRSGRRLQCLSGGFDRTRHSTYHAYENILLETMRYAEDQGLGEVAFGPITNASKAALMPEFARFSLRFYSRSAAVRRFLAFVLPRSAMRPSVFAPYAGLDAGAEHPAREPSLAVG